MKGTPQWIKNVIDTLSGIHRQDAMTFLVFVVLSAAFWFATTAYQKSDATFTVKLNIEGQPASAVFTTRVPNELKVTLYDTNSRLFRYSYNKEIKSLTVDFSRYADVAGNFRISGAELQSLLLNNLMSMTQITAISPALVDARYAMTGGKKVPVQIAGTYTCAGNYSDFKPMILPDSVTIHAPSYILDTLSCIRTEPLSYYGLKDTLHIRKAIDLAVGVKSTPDSVNIIIPVVQYVEKRISHVPINAINLPYGKGLTLFPRECEVKMLVSFDHYTRISPSDFLLTVDYKKIRNDKQQFLPVTVSCKLDPSIVQGITINPVQVEYSIDE